jgi:hypothetical protein
MQYVSRLDKLHCTICYQFSLPQSVIRNIRCVGLEVCVMRKDVLRVIHIEVKGKVVPVLN